MKPSIFILGLLTISFQVQAQTFYGRETWTFTLLTPGAGVKDPSNTLFYPPEGPTQRNLDVKINIVSMSGKLPADGQIVRKDLTLAVGGTKQKALNIKAKTTGPTDPFANGTKLVMTVTFDRYGVNALGQYPAKDASQFMGETEVANFSHSSFQQFIVKNGLRAAIQSGNIEVPFFKAAYSIPIANGAMPVRASEAMRGGDCGASSMVLEAIYRWAGYAARSAVGYCSLKAGNRLGKHVWVEVSDQKSWLPMEPAFRYWNDPLLSRGRMEESFIMHYGFGITGDYQDEEGRPCKVNERSLQTPRFYHSLYPGKGNWVNRGNHLTIKVGK